MSFSRYALVNTEQEELLSVLESHIGTDQMKDGQKQKQIRIIHSSAEEEPRNLQELLSLPRDACRVAIYEGPGLTFPRRPKYFTDYKDAIFYALKELTCEDTHSATVEVFESVTGELSLGATLSDEDLTNLGIA